MCLKYKDIPNKALLNNAYQYLLSAELLFENNSLNKGVILCSSFSIELLLKSFNCESIPQNVEKISENNFFWSGVIHKPKDKGHNLLTLFNKLSDDHKNIIINLPKFGNKMELAVDFFDKNKNLFIEWRYSHESINKNLNLTELVDVNRQLYESIQSISSDDYFI